jgi:hypothetical protein
METQVKQHFFPDCILTIPNMVLYNANMGSLNHIPMKKTIIPDNKKKMERRNYCQMEAVCLANHV